MNDNKNDDDFDLAKIIEELYADYERRKIRRENPYVLHLIRVLLSYGKQGMRRVDAIDRVWRLRKGADVAMPKEFEATVQSAYNHHCAESQVFRS
jgi:hypothetical protein